MYTRIMYVAQPCNRITFNYVAKQTKYKHRIFVKLRRRDSVFKIPAFDEFKTFLILHQKIASKQNTHKKQAGKI